MIRHALCAALAGLAAAGALPPGAGAQERIPSHCVALSEAARPVPASWSAPVAPGTVALHYIDHAMVLIRADGGTDAVTDFNGYIGPTAFLPEVVTMNHAHGTHWAPYPDPDIAHVLRGWGDGVAPTLHRLDLGDMLVRNVPTDIRRGGGTGGGVEKYGNSIFVFETAGLCIGHLGHLHHAPDAAQYAEIGRVDVVIAAVDGGLTLDLPTMLSVMERMKARVVIPVHWFGEATLERFLAGMAGDFDIVRVGGPDIVLSLDRLPARPTVMVLEPAFLSE